MNQFSVLRLPFKQFLKINAALLIGALFLSHPFALATDTKNTELINTNVQYLASACANCHGTHGVPQGNAMPTLAGLDAAYIREQMHLFKTGKRTATVMHQLANAYNDAEINALANYFSAQPTKP
jgi:cytochrome subunit of sulfide dehydrogenase